MNPARWMRLQTMAMLVAFSSMFQGFGGYFGSFGPVNTGAIKLPPTDELASAMRNMRLPVFTRRAAERTKAQLRHQRVRVVGKRWADVMARQAANAANKPYVAFVSPAMARELKEAA